MKNYKKIAVEKMKGQNHMHALVYFIYAVITSVASSFYGIAQLIVAGPLEAGYSKYLIEVSEGKVGKIETLFKGFSEFVRYFIVGLLKMIFLVLWSMLFLIPGIIKALAYSMTFFLMNDDPKLEGNNAITKSRELMNGNKGKLFGIYLSFFPQILLGLITLGIYFFWLIPTMNLAKYEFYLDLTGKSKEEIEGEAVEVKTKEEVKEEPKLKKRRKS